MLEWIEHVASDGATCLIVGVHEKPDLLESFHEYHTCELGWESWGQFEFGIGGDAISPLS